MQVKNESITAKKFIVNESGVFHQNEQGLHKICAPLFVSALVRDKASENWGKLLEFKDADGSLHQWLMPMEMLKGNGDELRGELLRLGLEISPGHRSRHLLLEYIFNCDVSTRGRCVQQIGWQDTVFVFPERIIGHSTERVVFQAEHTGHAFTSSGSLSQWRMQIAQLCQGNSRLILAVSTAFAGLLLKPSGMESGGLHLVGESSTGKTTALKVAASVFGNPSFLQRWRATTNGIEALAAMRSDTLLVLDELAQIEAKEAGEIAYMLANGSGKARANKNGASRARQTWRLLFLSAGEVSLEQHLREGGKRIKVGQTVRMLDIPADAGQGLGLFESLPVQFSAVGLSQQLTQATAKYYGTAAPAFLEQITQPDFYQSLPNTLETLSRHFLRQYLPENSGGQVHRACERFGLIAAAGELASDFEITGWSSGEATQAVAKCFHAWLQQRGGTEDLEKKNALAQIRVFFEAHGMSRFSDWYISGHIPIPHRAGFKRTVEQMVHFYVLPETFKREICQGLDFRQVSQWLLKEGWLEGDKDGNPYRREYLPNMGRTRCYVFTPKLWQE